MPSQPGHWAVALQVNGAGGGSGRDEGTLEAKSSPPPAAAAEATAA